MANLRRGLSIDDQKIVDRLGTRTHKLFKLKICRKEIIIGILFSINLEILPHCKYLTVGIFYTVLSCISL
jgi:hypothetical protein